jgi:hypothetical protein
MCLVESRPSKALYITFYLVSYDFLEYFQFFIHFKFKVDRKINFCITYLLYFIEYSANTSIVRTLILQFYQNTLFVNKVGKCYLPSIVCRQYYSIIFNEKSAHCTRL